MTARNRIKTQRILREAEGYLELEMPRFALDVLLRIDDPGTHHGRLLHLRGEALRALERYDEAIVSLGRAADLSPSDIHVWLALGWCHKRKGRLDLAIEALEHAQEVEPGEALIYYNLACYWSLAANKRHVLSLLSRALAIEPDYRDLIDGEPDFDPMRDDPDFQSLTNIIV